MGQNKKIVIINSEKISENEGYYSCDNIDMKSIPEGLSKNFDIFFIAKKSNIKRSHRINLRKIKIVSNIFSFISAIINTFKNRDTKYLLVSITPYVFFSYILLFIFRKKIFVYLRSSGHEEYKAKLGFIGYLFYHVMYSCVTFKSKIISCQKRLVKNKDYDLVFPSELDARWFENISKPTLDIPRILYVGRIRVEKGIFSFLKMFSKINTNIKLSIVGKSEDLKITSNNINLVGFIADTTQLIKNYDQHNITVLPSFTEAHPKVVDESLARGRPVIIFEEIKHIEKKFGIFVSKRNVESLLETIQNIMNSYDEIQKKIKKNKLPTKKEFILGISNILTKQ